MPRKRLADLLKEEAQTNPSPENTETNAVIDVTATPVSEKSELTTLNPDTENIIKKLQAELETSRQETTDLHQKISQLESVAQDLAATQQRESNLQQQITELTTTITTLEKAQKHQAQLQEKVTELTATITTLEKAQKHQAKLQEKVTELTATITTLEKSQKHQANLQEKITTLELTLAEEQNMTERLKKELYDAKKDALQLAESNSQLTAELTNLKQGKTSSIVRKEAEIAKSLSYRKSHRAPERVPLTPPTEREDNSSQMWLLD
ncbi:hypothetical protein [Calothrix sp. 336/3]|uniref:hypothetical protein n=1 Tax=Calothrix sp. 336/3 TaxID=1337936 RepID=UPI00069A7AC2|nr:hypothetical protein [Calothrix sp. 336/3]